MTSSCPETTPTSQSRYGGRTGTSRQLATRHASDGVCLCVQSRGGPLRFELSSWLQIEGAAPEDAGTYRCVARNTVGSTSASAVLGVLGAGQSQNQNQSCNNQYETHV